MHPILTGCDKMKKYLCFLLTLCLSGMLLVGCNLPKPDPDDPTEETENPKAGDDGYWCWKMTTKQAVTLMISPIGKNNTL